MQLYIKFWRELILKVVFDIKFYLNFMPNLKIQLYLEN